MRPLIAVTAVVLLACLGLAGAGGAQTAQAVQIQGTLQAVDCQNQTLTVNTASGAQTFQATGQTGVYVNGAPTPLCSIQSVVGSQVTVTVVPSGDEVVLGQVAVSAPQEAAQPAVSSGTSNTSTLVGIALGALILGGLAYLAIHNANNNANNYPGYYYGYGPSRPCPANAWSQWCRSGR